MPLVGCHESTPTLITMTLSITTPSMMDLIARLGINDTWLRVTLSIMGLIVTLGIDGNLHNVSKHDGTQDNYNRHNNIQHNGLYCDTKYK